MAENTHTSLCLNVKPLMEKMIRLKENSLSWKVASQAFSSSQLQMPRRTVPQSSGEASASSCWWWGRFFKMGAPRGPRRKKAKKHRRQSKQGKKERGPWVHPSFRRLFKLFSTWRRGHTKRSDEGEKLEEIPLLVLDGSGEKD
ncbi:uncharacterized LOC122455338 homolog [Monodelphis domestica]|uniref:uncharacterized LOC122455338 homolog n=1 Tax=Monodelphis domestica TaxID=13616 RepID=UPI0024E1EBB9|nr:uncharacterized LOC122455338 homolog [Monodelphis domestica]